jgi:hypothetical protein
MITISCIFNKDRNDYLTDTVFDGLASLQENGQKIQLYFPYGYKTNISMPAHNILEEKDFIERSKNADLILLFNNGLNVNLELAEKIGRFNKTFFIDGDEPGKDNRFNSSIVEGIKNGTYQGRGVIRFDLLKKCAGYFRREPPYLDGITPLPFGIERRYIQYKEGFKKDIDFVCIFGQEKFPTLRKDVREYLEIFSKNNGFSYVTKQTKIPFFNIHSKFAQKRFHKLLARAKVGVSVGGGGFDTLRFWEILGNNCILLTEKINLFKPEDNTFPYKRISQFSDLESFKIELQKVAESLKSYNQENLKEEYARIINDHSTEARVKTILREAVKKGIL